MKTEFPTPNAAGMPVVVSFRPRSRDRYQPWVWSGQLLIRMEGGEACIKKVWHKHPPIKRAQVNAFRNRFAPKRKPEAPIPVYTPRVLIMRPDVGDTEYICCSPGCGHMVKLAPKQAVAVCTNKSCRAVHNVKWQPRTFH